MDIDPTQPWGTAIDYAGRATIVEDGHTVHINVTDTSLSSVIEPDPITGRHPAVYVSAQFTETGDSNVVLRGYGQVSVQPTDAAPVTPDPTAIQRAVAAAIADFRANTAACAALCAAWTTPAPPPETGEEPAPA
ncbi:ATP-binding protein [Streptomyces sp. NPDC052023]|uniref:ATP-binding protein n=1 Tax=Streptomyces sp. NPDC052023 TaxID=3365681 RepID=UPI0037D7B664